MSKLRAHSHKTTLMTPLLQSSLSVLNPSAPQPIRASPSAQAHPRKPNAELKTLGQRLHIFPARIYCTNKQYSIIKIMLSDIMHSGLVWQLKQEEKASAPAIDSGFTVLNEQLVWGGWPVGGLSEIVYGDCGNGEVSLLLPALARISQSACVACLKPPQGIYWHGLPQTLKTRNFLILEPSAKDELWAAEQALRSGCFGALIFWPSQPLSFTQYRRLQILCGEHQACGFIMMPSERPNTPCRLRLGLKRLKDQRLSVTLIKHPGMCGQHSFQLALSAPQNFRYPVSSVTPQAMEQDNLYFLGR